MFSQLHRKRKFVGYHFPRFILGTGHYDTWNSHGGLYQDYGRLRCDIVQSGK